jgi:hypothetical protein
VLASVFRLFYSVVIVLNISQYEVGVNQRLGSELKSADAGVGVVFWFVGHTLV